MIEFSDYTPPSKDQVYVAIDGKLVPLDEGVEKLALNIMFLATHANQQFSIDDTGAI